MITVIYNRSTHKLTADGHACSNEIGRDLICASVTTLVYTLSAFVKNMAEAKQTIDHHISVERGTAEISCVPHNDTDIAVTLVFDAICAGFDILAQKYPDYISYDIV